MSGQILADTITKTMSVGAELMRGQVLAILRRELSPDEALRIAVLVMQVEI